MGVTSKLRALGGPIVLLVLASPGAAGTAEWLPNSASPQRVVAIGDVHGDFDSLVSILAASGLVDSDLRWTGGGTTLVQTGDLLDRGPDVREVMDLLIRLQRESATVGGRVICLMGNHEAMNLLGVVDEVSQEAYARFEGPESQSRRKAAWKQQVGLWRRLAAGGRRVVVEVPDETRERWYEQFPLGSFEYFDALGPGGEYGSWLRSLPVSVVVGDTLFVHGGLTPSLRGLDVEALNRRALTELEAFETARHALLQRDLGLPWSPLPDVEAIAVKELSRLSDELSERQRSQPEVAAYIADLEGVVGWGDWLLVSDEGPLCTRTAFEWDETEHRGEMQELIAGFGASRMVVGHSPQSSASIEPRFDHRVFLIDTGMLASHYHGRPSALEICGDAVTAVYPNERQVLVAPGATSGEPGAAAGTPAGVEAPGGDEGPRAREGHAEEPISPAGQPPGLQWLDVDGAPLPFQLDREIEDFLTTAEVVAQEDIPVGVTGPRKMVLEKGGVRVHAVFKDVDQKEGYVSLKVAGRERVFRDFWDYHLHECAAYRFARLLGLRQVPPAVPRRIEGRSGSLVLWLEHTISFTERRDRQINPPDPEQLARQLQVMLIFDATVGDTDGSNLGNTLIDRHWNLWFIDCSRCFITVPFPLAVDKIERCERGLWTRLNQITEEDLRAALGDLLTRSQVSALAKRKAAVVEHIADLIRERGELSVLFDLEPLLSGEPEE